MPAKDQERCLRIYLQDHLALLRGAVELAHRMKQHCEEEWAREAATRFLGGVIEDRKELMRVARDVGVEPSLVKEAGAWLAQKLGGLKLNGRVLMRSPLSTLLELEAMCMLMAQTEASWRALEPFAEARPDLEMHPRERARAARRLREELLEVLPMAGEGALLGAREGLGERTRSSSDATGVRAGGVRTGDARTSDARASDVRTGGPVASGDVASPS